MSIWRFLLLLPSILEALTRVQKVIKDYDVEKWLKELDVAVKKAEEANDQKSRRQAAIDIAHVISKL